MKLAVDRHDLAFHTDHDQGVAGCSNLPQQPVPGQRNQSRINTDESSVSR